MSWIEFLGPQAQEYLMARPRLVGERSSGRFRTALRLHLSSTRTIPLLLIGIAVRIIMLIHLEGQSISDSCRGIPYHEEEVNYERVNYFHVQ
jgi:hypothetical protein